ncbi:BTB domain-containing protein [Mycena kentingensis (nom. inval.)]|nr:BTB domain-containing protein [Mycena kentingensis (nom. inval.)]
MEDATATDTPSAELTKCKGLWLTDCGLVIRAENTVFRVSRDLIAMQSPIFADMLSLPPAEGQEKFDGCPMVLLSDSAADVEVFLRSLIHYDFFPAESQRITFDDLSGIIRMSHKYEVAGLRRRAFAKLSHYFPTTLQQFDALGPAEVEWISDERSAVILARRTDQEWILPAALYTLCRYGRELNILACDEMPVADKYRWVIGCRKLMEESLKALAFLLDDSTMEDCRESDVCYRTRVRARMEAEQRCCFSTSEALFGPLEIWTEDNMKALQVCNGCLNSMRLAHISAREAFWAGLPELFDLPAWDVLEKLKAEAMADESEDVDAMDE